MKQKIHMCSECAAGENYDEPAILLVTGHDGVRPFRKWVCEDHYTMLTDDGLVKKIIDRQEIID